MNLRDKSHDEEFTVINLRQLIDFRFFGRHRLENIELLPLGCAIADAVKLYGEPTHVGPSKDVPEFTEYVFSPSAYHDAVVVEWDQRVQSIIYWSTKSDPSRDLRCMLDRYEENSQWKVMEVGYWYQREDGKVRLWCSAIPAIGVAYVEFLSAKTSLTTANRLKQLNELEDATWAPNDVITELQRQFVESNHVGLKDWASRSTRIAVSPDGRDVFVVRDHHAYDVPGGFMELNGPPEPDSGYSTQVINSFTWSENASIWQKIVLPTDANVDCIHFEEDQCRLALRHTKTNRVLTFTGTAVSIRRLSTGFGPFHDGEMWEALEEKAEPEN